MTEDRLKESFRALHPGVSPSSMLLENVQQLAAEADARSEVRSRNRFMRWGIGIAVTLTAMAATSIYLTSYYLVPWITQANHHIDHRIARQNDPEAIALLKKSADAMIHLNSYRAECWTTTTEQPKALNQPSTVKHTMAQIVEVKPDLMRFERWEMVVNTDGKPGTKSLWKRTGDIPSDTYTCNGKVAGYQRDLMYFTENVTSTDEVTFPDQVARAFTVLSETWQGFFSTSYSPYGDVFLDTENSLRPAIAVKHMGKASVEGVLCDKVLVHYHFSALDYPNIPNPPVPNIDDEMIYWYIGSDGLIRRREDIAHMKTATIIEDEIMRNIQVNVPVTNPESLFNYTPPKGVTYKRWL